MQRKEIIFDCRAKNVRVAPLALTVLCSYASRASGSKNELSAANRHIVHIPVGFAHGFLSLKDNSCLVYKTDAVHAPAQDTGDLWNSFGISWPVETPLLSVKDAALSPLEEFDSPFAFRGRTRFETRVNRA